MMPLAFVLLGVAYLLVLALFVRPDSNGLTCSLFAVLGAMLVITFVLLARVP